MKKKIIISILIIITAIIAAIKFWPKSIEQQYELARVNRETIRQTVTASGKVKSKTQVDLKFFGSGLVSWVGVKKGDTVKKWQALASLDKRELEKDLKKYLLDFSKERADFDEDIKVTYRDKVLTDSISRILAKNQYDLDKAVLDVEIKDLAIKLATITSPIDGIVTHVEVPVPGVNVLSTVTAFTVADPNNLIFEAELDETDIGQVAVGQPAELKLDAFPDEPIHLTVNRIDFAASLDSGGATVYLVEFDLPADDRFRLGLNGEIAVTTAEKTAALTVPYACVDSGNQVRIVRRRRVENQTVVTGIVSDEKIEITDGLNEGDTVVVAEKK